MTTDLETSPCKGCGAEIGWIKTPKGRNMPVNPKKVPFMMADGTLRWGYVPHWATCPKAQDFKKGESGGK